MKARNLLATGVATALACAALAATAGAATLELKGDRMLYEAAPGELNSLTIPRLETKAPLWEFFGGRAALSTGEGCEVTSIEANTAECPAAFLPIYATLRLGDGSDVYQQSGYSYSENDGPSIYVPLDEPIVLTVEGGDGDDEFWTTVHGAPLSLFGGNGNDRFQFVTQATPGTAGLPGRYLLDGGEGDDWMQVQHPTPVLPPGSTLTLEAGPGNDGVIGSSGDDTIRGGLGDDRLFDRAGNDWMEGGEGNDLVAAGYGADFLSGGPGNDELQANGEERLDGGPGDDRIHAANGAPDEIGCGEGFDRVYLDPLADVIATDCERFFPSETCPHAVDCTATISVKALAPGRPLLGRVKFGFRGVSMGGNRIPLSKRGRAYVARSGTLTVIRTSRISWRRKGKKPRVAVKHMTLNLKAA